MMVKDDLIYILFLTKPWLESNIRNTFIQIEGYDVHGEDRVRKGGGIALYEREEYTYSHEVRRTVMKWVPVGQHQGSKKQLDHLTDHQKHCTIFSIKQIKFSRSYHIGNKSVHF